MPWPDGPRRAGAAAVVADVSLARRMRRGPELTLDQAMASAWESWQQYVAVENLR